MGCSGISNANMTDVRPSEQGASNSRLVFPIIGAVVFAIVFFVLVLQGGMCERYEAKMRRMEMRKQMLEDARNGQ
jgi:Na+/glutamate symporter